MLQKNVYGGFRRRRRAGAEMGMAAVRAAAAASGVRGISNWTN